MTIIILCFLCLIEGNGKNAVGVWKDGEKDGEEDDEDEETGFLEGKTVSYMLPFEFES